MNSTDQLHVVKRLGKAPHQRALLCAVRKTCPDIFALSSGDYAIIGKDLTGSLALPEDAGCGADERIVLLPREVLVAARLEIPKE